MSRDSLWKIGTLIALGLLHFVFAGRDFQSRGPVADFPGWPRGMLPAGSENAPLPPWTQAWVGREGGRMAAFIYENETWLVRWLPGAQRSAHPAEECFLAAGFQLSDLRLFRDPEGVMWREFAAHRGLERWLVRQRWVATDGESWTDVSAWYWAVRTRPRASWSFVQVIPNQQL